MVYNKYLLPPHIVLNAFLNVYDKQHEICGSYKLKNKKIINANCFNGKQSEGRYFCSRDISTVTLVTYHTHICNTPGYPSYEDLVTLIDEKKYMDIIYTCWGIWVITRNGVSDKNYIKTLLDRKNSPFNNGIDRIQTPTKKVIDAINLFIKHMKNNNYDIKFYTWEKAGEIYINIPQGIISELE